MDADKLAVEGACDGVYINTMYDMEYEIMHTLIMYVQLYETKHPIRSR